MARRKKVVQGDRVTSTPATFRGNPVSFESMHGFMEEWSLRQAEENHVETIEEANDFGIDEDDEDILHPSLTVYEMHEAAEDNLQLLEEMDIDQAESNETVDEAQAENSQNLHDQSALVEHNSPDHSSLSSQTEAHSSP